MANRMIIRSRLVFVAVAAIIFAPAATVAQTPIKDPTAVVIAQQSLAAMSGTALIGFQDVTVTGTTTLYGDTGTVSYPITVIGTGRASVRSSIQKPSRTDVYVSDGTTACLNGNQLQDYGDSYWGSLPRRIDFIPALSLLRDYATSNMNVQYAGVGTVNGSPSDVIALSFQPTNARLGASALPVTQRLFYVDQATSSLVKIQYTMIADPTTSSGPKVELYFAKYQSVSGFAVPFQQSTYIDGKLGQALAITSVNFNTGIDPSTLQPTCGVNNAQ